MSAEGTPRTEPSLLARPLAAITALVVRYPVTVVALAVLATVLSLFVAGTRLGFRTSRLDLLNPNSSFNQLWIDYINEFGDRDDVVIVVEGESREAVVPVLAELSTDLARREGLFRAVLHEVDLSRIRGKGLHYLPAAEIQATERFLNEIDPILAGDWARLNLGNMVSAMFGRLTGQSAAASPESQMAAQAQVTQLADSLLYSLNSEDAYRSPWPEMPCSVTTLSELSSEYLLTKQGKMGFVLLQLADEDDGDFAQGSRAIDELRHLISQAQTRHPETQIGLTGLPVMENDEMRSSRTSMSEASLLSLFGVACLFVAGFGGLRHPLMTVGVLLLGIAWTLGFVTVAVGHLNILSIAFGSILIGLGIDFGIHYVARYMQLRGTMRSSSESLCETARSIGPGVITGAVTTAVAFFMAGFTEFTGLAELGVIAGGGVLLCCLGAMFVLPALIHLSDSRRFGQTLPVPLDVSLAIEPLLARPALLLGVATVGTALVCVGLTHLRYDHNLLNLQAVGLESVELERRLLKESDQSAWFALSIADTREELLARKAEFLALPSVQKVEEIASLFPTADQHKATAIQRIQQRLAGLPERPPQLPVESPEQLGRVLGQLQAVVTGSPQAMRVQRQLELVRDAMRRMSLADCYRWLSGYQHQMAGDLLSRLHTLRAMADPAPPQFTDLPESLVTRFVGQDGKFLLRVYSKGHLEVHSGELESIWGMRALEQFVREVRSVDPRVTGNPLQAYEASRQMKQSYIHSAWYALAAIIFILFLDFCSIGYTMLAMVPLALGMLQMFGILGLLDLPLNPANMIVLPLILGIGIDDGVHVVHDFRRQSGRYRISASTASAILITSLTTMIGFGSLMIACHQGLQSLGRVLTIGVSCCLFNSFIVLPAILTLVTRNRPEPENLPDSERTVPQPIRRRDPAHRPSPVGHAARPVATLAADDDMRHERSSPSKLPITRRRTDSDRDRGR
ncbi:MAG: MMPL family transporter [Rhodopirellula sp.]|nr:MMPL family transporter [Rhodopirellula sp.]